MISDLSKYEVKTAPATVYYIPNFISENEEAFILKKVYEVPKPKWTCLKNRRLQDYGGVPHAKGMIPEDLPTWLSTFVNKVNEIDLFDSHKCNHVLVNEYLPNQGIMAHYDGPLFHPVISTITCGSHSVLEFVKSDNGSTEMICNILLERRSLVILSNDMYTKYMHLIREVNEDIIEANCMNLNNCCDNYEIGDSLKRDTRISLTIRNVPKVSKMKLFNLLKK